ncbi:LptF/LptG family permease [Alphaproteobacteria bacterium]|nr:LptF/LptG family permease [Alphaproteobacteria bacterium]
MIGGTKYYIIINYFKYILINILVFVGLIWISQILRVLELQYSLSTQIFDVIQTTSLILPSFLSPLSSFLLILASFFLNFQLNSSNEIVIIKQYFSFKDIFFLFLIIMAGLFLLNLLNNEYFAVKSYEKYKNKELEIRNNFKLGMPSQRELHIDNELSIFFDSEIDDVFYNVEALIYEDGQFIVAKSAEIEVAKKNFNLIFQNGERLSLNNDKISKTRFEKFIYSIQNENIEKLFYDKEHFNTLELILHDQLDFINHGHNRIFQYLLIILTILISLKIIFVHKEKKSLIKLFMVIFLLLLVIQVINSYLIFLLNNQLTNIPIYYFLNFLNLSSTGFIIFKVLK